MSEWSTDIFWSWAPVLKTVLTAVVSSGIIGLIAGPYYKAKIEGSVRREIESDLEKIKSELRSREDSLKAELNRRESELHVLQAALVNNTFSRHAKVEEKRLDATISLWKTASAGRKYNNLVLFVSSLKINKINELIRAGGQESQRMKDFINLMYDSFDIKEKKFPFECFELRPFVSDKIWKLFYAYLLLQYSPITISSILKSGPFPEDIFDVMSYNEEVKAAMPDLAEYIDKFGYNAAPHLLEELDRRLLAEIILALDGSAEEADLVRRSKATFSGSPSADAQRVVIPEAIKALGAPPLSDRSKRT
jgi:hypothetical protein